MNNFVNQLVNALESLKNQGVYGIRDIDSIMMDFNSKLGREIVILHNDQFEINYNKQSNETTFKTTYSGQIINNEFLDKIRIIDNAKGTIHTIINTMYALKLAETK